MVINIRKIEKSKQEILKQYKELIIKKEEIEIIRNSIGELPDRDEIIVQIRKIENRIEEQCRKLLILMQALDEIIDMYIKSEQEIIDNFEGIVKMPTGLIAIRFDFDPRAIIPYRVI